MHFPKKLLHAFGALICVVLLGYLAWRAIHLWDDVSGDIRNNPPWQGLLAAMLLSALAYVPLSVGWLLLLSVRITPASLRGSMAIVLLSQAARYLPGNVGHLIGKALLTRNWLSMSLVRITALLTVELLLCMLAALLAGAFGIPYLLRALPLPPWIVANWEWALGTGCVVLIGALLAPPVRSAMARFQFPSFDRCAIALAAYSINVLLGGAAVWALATQIYPGNELTLGLAILAYALAWLAGFVTPGAPAGLGVREFVFVIILGPAMGESPALILAGLLRLAAILGDIIAFSMGAWLRAHGYPEPVPVES